MTEPAMQSAPVSTGVTAIVSEDGNHIGIYAAHASNGFGRKDFSSIQKFYK